MSNQKYTAYQKVGMGIGFIISGVGIACLLISGVKTLNRDTADYEAKTAELLERKKAYNLTHPEIVGTNEIGEVIKCYTIPIDQWNNHYVYEIGTTKTMNVSFGKGGLEVVVEKH